MRYTFLTLISLTFFAVSCKKTNSAPLIPEGIYTGTFQRQTSTGGEISNVSITFSADNWEGQTEFEKYPALCHGTYKTSGLNNVTFQNACPWTTEFDWSLILSGDYKIKIDDHYIEISRDYKNGVKDIYKLTKQ